jgi:hypothetical protein
MTLRLKQNTEVQKWIRGEELDTNEKTHYLEGTMTLGEDKPFFIKHTNLDK